MASRDASFIHGIDMPGKYNFTIPHKLRKNILLVGGGYHAMGPEQMGQMSKFAGTKQNA